MLVYEMLSSIKWPNLVPFPRRICNSDVVEPDRCITKFGEMVNLDSGFLIPVEAVSIVTILWSQKVLETQAILIKLALLRQCSVDEKYVAE